MYRIACFAAVCALSASAVMADAPSTTDEAAIEKSFSASLQPNDLSDWMALMASEPNHVGSPHDKANAEWELAKFKEFGWDAHIETFQVLYPTPISEALELKGPKPFRATLQEPLIPDDTSARAKQYALPAYLAYQGDGEVTAPLVYVNYGMPDDYKALQRMGISVQGKIVIARYGSGWRGLKPKLAQEHGAVGCIIYSDPADDGYAVDATYPNGPQRPAHGFQRGSVQDMTLYPGDPLTPGIGATADAKRLTRETAPTILKIPALPISYADAQVFLSALGGQPVPENWRGALPITYRPGPSKAMVHLMVKSDWSLKTLYDVVGVLKGSQYPDQWVVRGNHRDGWVFGASDPLSGQVGLLEEVKALGALEKNGWRPKRTIVFLSWDGEEPGLLGSTEWAEEHADELKQKAIIYINTDGTGRGFLGANGSHDFEHFIDGVASDVADPETHLSVAARRRAKLRVDALASDAKEHAKEEAKIAADPARDIPIEAMGSGSDYSTFLEHLGVPALDLEFTDEGDSGGVYHSRYDTFEHHSKWVDPGFVYDTLLADVVGVAVLRLADSELPQQHAGNFADTMAWYVKELKKLADDKREAQAVQAKLLADNAFALTADPTKSSGIPTPLKPVPKFDFAPLDNAAAKLKVSATSYDDAFAANAVGLSAEQAARLWSVMQNIDQTLTPDVGLPGRPWFKNVIYAPGRLTGYGAKTLPGVREGIEDERWDDATAYIKITADALNAYSERLDQATTILKGH